MIAVIDGQGGGIGATIIRRIREVFGEKLVSEDLPAFLSHQLGQRCP
jgi:hypothetical protein